MRVISFNANGIRSAAKKGFYEWLAQQDADVVCIQETKSQEHQLDHAQYRPSGYHCYYFDAEKKGYSGVALYARKKPDKIITGLDFSIADTEGRYIQANFGSLCVASVYLPSGSSGPERQTIKYEFLNKFEKKLNEIICDCEHDYILCGDWNIAHKQIDLKNWRSNQKNSGFLPEERAWLDKIFAMGFVDAFRVINPRPNEYTWWSNRGQARAKNVGWRIDYQIITPRLKSGVIHVAIYRDQFFSDHAPLLVEYKI